MQHRNAWIYSHRPVPDELHINTLARSEDLKSLQAESWYPGFVLLMVLFSFYYSEYLTHLWSPRRLYPAPIVSHEPPQDTVSLSLPILPSSIRYSYSFKLLPPLVCPPFPRPPLPLYSCFLLWSIFLQQTNDRHWWTQGSIQGAHTQQGWKRERERDNGSDLFCRNLFLMKHKKAIKLR